MKNAASEAVFEIICFSSPVFFFSSVFDLVIRVQPVLCGGGGGRTQDLSHVVDL